MWWYADLRDYICISTRLVWDESGKNKMAAAAIKQKIAMMVKGVIFSNHFLAAYGDHYMPHSLDDWGGGVMSDTFLFTNYLYLYNFWDESIKNKMAAAAIKKKIDMVVVWVFLSYFLAAYGDHYMPHSLNGWGVMNDILIFLPTRSCVSLQRTTTSSG